MQNERQLGFVALLVSSLVQTFFQYPYMLRVCKTGPYIRVGSVALLDQPTRFVFHSTA